MITVSCGPEMHNDVLPDVYVKRTGHSARAFAYVFCARVSNDGYTLHFYDD